MPEPEDLEKTLPTMPQKGKQTPDAAETQQVNVPAAPKKGRRSQRLRWLIGSVVGFIVFLGLGALGGMQAGFSTRLGVERQQRAVEAVVQFNYGVDDLANGRCDLAVQRFQYVIQLDAGYPGIVDKYAQSMLCAGGTATPTGAPVNGATPTPDLRGADVIYADAQAQLGAQNWDGLLTALDSLRASYPDYKAIEIDGLYYVGLRNRGVNRILQVGDLEGGIFDLDRAAQIGPLDAEADTYRQWAISYVVGASFWEIDWTQVVNYFQPLAAAAPNLHDVNFFTAQDRLATAVVGYAQELIAQADRFARDKQWCSASDAMSQAASYGPLDSDAESNATFYSDKCALDGNE
jgi:hypothetical protein